MHTDPNTASIIVFFVLSFWGLVLADGQQRLFSPTDVPVSVVRMKSQVSAGSSDIKSCLIPASPTPSFRVRFQKLKTKTATFTRTLSDRVLISTYASKRKTVAVSNIVNCVNVADAEGFEGFSFNEGTCEMFKMESQACKCETGGQDIFYVQASFWDPKDSTLPQLVYEGYNAVAVVHLTSTFSDQRQLFAGRTASGSLSNATSVAAQSSLSCARNGFYSCKCLGSECFTNFFIDILHCVPKNCNAPGNTTLLQSVSVHWDQMFPMLDLLSECGKTIVLDPSSYTGLNRFVRVMSHQGYGCQWYPKTGTDHECVVTISSGNRTSTSQMLKFEMVFDGNTTTCEGDALSLHDGAPTNSSLLMRYDACTTMRSASNFYGNASYVTLIFKRTAKQYQKDGFNWGFNLIVKLVLNP